MADRSYLDAPASLEDVTSAYRWILGREPRSETEAESLQLAHATRASLRRFLLATKGSLHEHLKARLGPEKWVLADGPEGTRIWLNLCDRHVSMGCLLAAWEPDETAFLRRAVQPGHTVVDIGANIGWFTLHAAAAVGETGRVHAFEPQPSVFAHLARTIVLNDLSARVALYPFALADAWATLALGRSGTAANMGNAWLDRDGDPATAFATARTGVLDDILGEAPVHFVKLDAEGAEALVLQGAQALLARCRPVVMIEIVPALLRKVSSAMPDDVLGFFASLRYKAHPIGPEGLRPPLAAWPDGTREMNLACIPQR